VNSFSTTTQEDCDWLCACIAAEGKDVYISDFEELDVYACRILVPAMSEIYPVEDLQWENNSVGNDIRPALIRLNDSTTTNAARCSTTCRP
jgi:ribosomal protein S12 methylthiotransferase accessory factor